MNTLLIEIGCEELPAKKISTLSQNMIQAFINLANKNNLIIQASQIQALSTPRRLSLIINNFPEKTLEYKQTKRGPNLQQAYNKDNAPTPAALGFAKSCNVTIDKLTVEKTDKGEWLSYTKTVPGVNFKDILSIIIPDLIKQTSNHRNMIWGNSELEFLRPIRWLLIMLDDQIIKLNFKDPELNKLNFSQNLTYGHRYLAKNNTQKITITNANKYKEILSYNFVLADPKARQNKILTESQDIANKLKAKLYLNNTLLTEINNLVEWPIALLGSFAPEFLNLPDPVLASAIIEHQKCIPLIDKNNNKFINKFIIISNIENKNPNIIIKGNEKVIHARLSDAKFIYDRDLNTSLKNRLDKLKNITLHNKLGSLNQQANRLGKICKYFAKSLNINPDIAYNTGLLAKTDLLTLVVNEFPELQGIIGGHYAQLNNEDPLLSQALVEQYLPKNAEDELPQTKLGTILSIADKADKLVGYFGINTIPTGDKDPLALRRAAQSLIRLCNSEVINLDLDLDSLFNQIKIQYSDEKINLTNQNLTNNLVEFCLERFKQILLNDYQIPIKIIDSVLCNNPTKIKAALSKIKALDSYYNKENFKIIIELNKRLKNILKQADLKKYNYQNINHIDYSEFEQTLVDNFLKIKTVFNQHNIELNYLIALEILCEIRAPLAEFFDNVMMFDENNPDKIPVRLNILYQIHTLLIDFADFTYL